MKINGNAGVDALNGTTVRTVGPGRVAPDATVSAAASIAPRAATGELVVRLAAQGAPVDEALVASIRDQLARGEYPVDADKIAAAMVAIDLGGNA